MGKEIIKYKNDKDFAAAKQLLTDMNIVDIAEELEEMDKHTAIEIFRIMPKDKAADIFSYMSRDMRQFVVQGITDFEIKEIIDDLFLDDAVDFIEEMPANVVKRVLANVTKEKRDLINQFLQYPKDSVGSIMTVEFVDLKADYTVQNAFEHIRKTGLDKETIYTCYIINSDRKLLGTVSVRALLLAAQTQKVTDIMDANLIFANTTEDKETLVINFNKYDLIAMPVVDNEHRLVGIVTVDDALEVQEQEATEDIEIMAAVSPSEEPYLRTSVIKLAKNRILWLMLLMLSATLTGMVISSFEDALMVVPALTAFIPMLMDTCGNSGSQTAVLVIRGMALGEIKMSNLAIVWWKEVRVAVLCGAALMLINFTRILLMNRDIVLAITTSLALYITVIIAKTIGCILPIFAKKFGLDPAVMASPVITTISDVISLIIFFNLAKVIMQI